MRPTWESKQKYLYLWSQLSLHFKLWLIGGLFIVIFATLATLLIRKSKGNEARAEAKIILSYLSALEAAYFTDNGYYVAFDEAYGASIAGKVNCTQPDGARELGFILRGCDRDPQHGGHRYAYRVYPVINKETGQPDLAKGYLAEATSGSRVDGTSLLCDHSDRSDRWQVGPDRVIKHVDRCR